MFFQAKNQVAIKFIQWVFYAFIGLFPFIFSTDFLYYGTTSRSINLILFVEILIVFLCILLFNKKNDLYITKSPITGALLLFLIVSFISAFFGVDFLSSFWSKATRMTGLFYFLHLGIFYLALLMILKDERVTRNVLKVFLISSGIASISTLLSNDGFGVIFTNSKLSGFIFGNSSFAAMYLYAAFIASIYFIVSSEKLKKHWWSYLIPLIFVINSYFININLWSGKVNLLTHPQNILGEAQASSIAMFISVIILLFAFGVSKIKQKNVQKYIMWGSLALGLFVAVFSSYSLLSENGYIRAEYLKQASNARPIVWQLSKKSIADRPLLGWGTDNFDRSFEKHYDSAVLEERNGGEAWFDRAHNIFIDQTVETGYLGTLSYILIYLTIFGCLVYVFLRSKEKYGQELAIILGVYFIGHIMEVQTAFDTSISYVPLALMTALVASLFYKTYKSHIGDASEWKVPKGLQYGVGAVLVLLFGYLFIVGTVPIVRANITNGSIRKAGTSEKRLLMYPALFGSPVDLASFLWRTTTDFQRGIAANPGILEEKGRSEGLVKELEVQNEEYRKYISEHPLDYRVRVSLAGTYIYERLFNVDHLDEAHKVLEDAIKLAPQIPQAYWEQAVAYLYQRKFDLARQWAKKGYDLDPNVEQSKKIIEYIEKSIKTFPNIDLYTFGQI